MTQFPGSGYSWLETNAFLLLYFEHTLEGATIIYHGPIHYLHNLIFYLDKVYLLGREIVCTLFLSCLNYFRMEQRAGAAIAVQHGQEREGRTGAH